MAGEEGEVFGVCGSTEIVAVSCVILQVEVDRSRRDMLIRSELTDVNC
jgi:hypothetical protein